MANLRHEKLFPTHNGRELQNYLAVGMDIERGELESWVQVYLRKGFATLFLHRESTLI
jgi:hypothetical protein